MKGWFQYILAGLILVIVIPYMGISYRIYDQLSVIKNGYQHFEGNTPLEFSVRDPKWASFNTYPYMMPHVQEIMFPSRESDLMLSGWFIPGSSNKPVIVVIHGKDESKASHKVLIPAGMLNRAGFNVLLFDLRDHGESTVEDGRFAVGSEEYLDVLGAADWLVDERQFSRNQIGFYGVSPGASVAIIAAANDQEIKATFADSPFADVKTIIDEEVARAGFSTFFSRGAIWWGIIIADDNLLKFNPIDQLEKLADRALFITQGSSDTRIHPHHGIDLFRASQKAGVKSSGWFLRDADHLETMLMMPDEYEEKLVGFFRENL